MMAQAMARKPAGYPSWTGVYRCVQEPNWRNSVKNTNDLGEILLREEDGELQYFAFACDESTAKLKVELWGDDGTYWLINDQNFQELLRLGRGIAPGDVTLQPSGKSPDAVGTPNPSFPYLTRYKDDSPKADYLNFTTNFYSMQFTPAIGRPYRKLKVNLSSNRRAGETLTIYHLEFVRYVGQTSKERS